MKKKIIALAVLICSAGWCAVFAQGGIKFDNAVQYADGCFTDVTDSAWYADEVAAVYSAGLMNGTGDSTFSPQAEVSVAQAITLSARLNAAFYKKTIPQKDGNWYDAYVEYARQQGFLKDGDFDDYTRTITRIEFVCLVSDCLPDEYYNPINIVDKIPDVASNDAAFSDVLKLYNAGVIMGNDEFGNFLPQNSLKRSEIAAIINRVADPSKRISKTLEKTNRDLPLVLVEDNEFPFHGWQRDTRGMSYVERLAKTNDNTLFGTLCDVSDTLPVKIMRSFRTQKSGVLTLVSNFKLSDVDSGFSICIDDGNGENVVCFEVKANSFYVGSKKVFDFDDDKIITLKAVIDLDNKVFDAYFDDTYAGEFEIQNTTASRIVMGFDEKGKGKFTPNGLYLDANYYINEKFLGNTNAADWEKINLADCKTVELKNANYSLEDINSIKLTGKPGEKASFKKQIYKAVGDVGFEIKFLSEKQIKGVSFRLGTKEKCFELTLDGTNIVAPDKAVVGKYTPGVWTTVRAELDADKGYALVRINGKDKGEFKLKGASLEFGEFGVDMETSELTEIFVDDILVYPVYAKPTDYVEKPVLTQQDEFFVGMNTCNLWRFGYWHGNTSSWQVVSAFDELTPYMGYYDDGNPEVSDWEIKWFAEHGIDYQLQCWYGPATGDLPVKTPGFSHNLHDGYFNSQYKNLSKFAIMWENNFTTKITSEGFRKYFVPFWIDYYFSDPNYFVIDNKPVFSIYSYPRFLEYFDNDLIAAKAELDYLREEVKKLGFDDIILMFANGAAQPDVYADMAYLGAEGAYNYNLGRTSDSADYQKKVMKERAEKASQYGISSDKTCCYVPTISVGFNAVARHDTRSDSISLENYSEVCRFVKGELLCDPDLYDQQSYMSKMVLLSCWNEYDEGHYLNPSNLYGFGFLDTLREHFTKSGIDDHTDVKPTENQVSRLQVLYPDNFSMLRPTRWYNYKIDQTESFAALAQNGERIVFEDFSDPAVFQNGWSAANCDVSDSTRGSLQLSPKGEDPFILKDFNFEAKDKQIVHIKFAATSENSNKDGYFQLFFKTKASNTYDSKKCISVGYVYSDTTELYIDPSVNEAWRGTITGLRFDFMNEMGKAEISLVEVVNLPEADKKITALVDGMPVEFEFPAVNDQNGMYVPFVPNSGIFGMLTASYKWSRFTGVLDVMIGQTNVVFTVGESTAVVDGKMQQLKKEMYLTDGIPMLPIDKLCEFAGFDYSFSGNAIVIDTKEYGVEPRTVLQYEKNRLPFTYNFDIDGYYESWDSFTNVASRSLSDGCLYIESKTKDPFVTMTNMDIDANSYITCKVRMKTDIAKDSKLVFYFAHNGASFGEAMTVKCAVSAENKDFVEYQLDMSENINWIGNVTQLRFDPVDCEGRVWIDSIAFEKGERNTEDKTGKEYKESPRLAKWDFTKSDTWSKEGWTAHQSSQLVTDNGKVSFIATGEDPIMKVENLNLELKGDECVHVRLKTLPTTQKALTNAQIFFTTSDSPDWKADKCVTVKYVTGINTDVYFEMKECGLWKGVLTGIRLDPLSETGAVEVDLVEIIRPE